VTTASYKSADTAVAIAGNIKSGIVIAGTTGNVSAESHSNCAADGVTGCVTTSSFKSAALAGFVAGDVNTGKTIAGVTGTATLESHSNCAADGSTGCVTTASYKSADTAVAIAGNIKSGIVIAGTTGNVTQESHSNCAADGSTGCVTTASYKSADTAVAVAGNIKSGIVIAGTTGTVTAESHSDCAADGSTGCVTTASFKSANMASAVAGNIKSGATIAGTAGSVTAESHSNCAADGSTGCVTTTSYKSADVAVAVAGNIKSGVTIAGTAGSVTAESHSNCAADGSTGCVTTSSYKSADMAQATAGNIKSGVTIAGTAGQYPSATYTLPSAGAGGALGLTTALWDARVKAATTFEYYDSSGTRYTQAGDADIVAANIKTGIDIFGAAGTVNESPANAWDIRSGVVVGSVTGSLKVNCRNRITSTIFNVDPTVGNTATTAGTSLDVWDTIDDYANNSNTIPSALPSAWGTDTVCSAATVWQDMTSDGTCDSAGDACVFKDKISGLQWAEPLAVATWSASVINCDTLSFASQTDWRLPTIYELEDAYIHGLRDLGNKGGTAGTASNNSNFIANVDTSTFWSATTSAAAGANAWQLAVSSTSLIKTSVKTGTASPFCVR
jgi:hypothetical protein